MCRCLLTRPKCGVGLQGFPDTHIFVGTVLGAEHDPAQFGKKLKKKFSSWTGSPSLVSRYSEVGNAVSPLVALALGSCMQLAMEGGCDPQKPVIWSPNTQYLQVSHVHVPVHQYLAAPAYGECWDMCSEVLTSFIMTASRMCCNDGCLSSCVGVAGLCHCTS